MKYKNYYLKGTIEMPGDKSISHRLLILSSMIKGKHIFKNLPQNDDINTTIEVLKHFGLKFKFTNDNISIIDTNEMYLKDANINCNESGTTARLMCGYLAGMNINCTINGVSTLLNRPMERIVQPLKNIGVNIEATDGKLPVIIKKSEIKQKFFESNLKVPSAQVKSALMLYAINSNQACIIKGKIHTRDHSERLLEYLDYPILMNDNSISLDKGTLKKIEFNNFIPGDISSASFFIAAAILMKDSNITIKNVCINSYRMGFIKKLKLMGANIKVRYTKIICGEKIGDITALYSPDINGIEIKSKDTASLIDEIPILCVVAAFAKGTTIINGVSELRFKESDRINSVIENFKTMKRLINIEGDNLVINPVNKLHSTTINSFGDHRIFMAVYIYNLVISDNFDTKIIDKTLSKSFPDFIETLNRLLYEKI